MKQVEGNTNNAPKGNADKQAVLPTDNSPNKNFQAKQGGNAKSGDSNAAGKGKRDTAPGANKGGPRQAGNKR